MSDPDRVYVSSVISSIRQMMSFANAMENLMPGGASGSGPGSSAGGGSSGAGTGGGALVYRSYLSAHTARTQLAAATAAAAAAAASVTSSTSTSSATSGGPSAGSCSSGDWLPNAGQATAAESRQEWLDSLAGRRLLEGGDAELHRLVLEYLVNQGHLEAAEVFRQEAIQLHSSECRCSFESAESASLRSNIREAVQSGRPADALAVLQAVRPGLLESRPVLAFRLRQQQLLELVRQGLVAEALELAQTELAPLATELPHLLPDLEECMALLAFERPAQSVAFGAWLSPGQRDRLASEANAALLEDSRLHGCGGDDDDDSGSNSKGRGGCPSRLEYLLRLTLWSQDRLAASPAASAAKLRFPRLPADGIAEAAFEK